MIINETNDYKVELNTTTSVEEIVIPSVNKIDDLVKSDTELRKSIAENVRGIAKTNEIKQDKLAQQDLDNIAALNQLPDKLNSISMTPSQNIALNFINFNDLIEGQTINKNITSNGYVFLRIFSDKDVIIVPSLEFINLGTYRTDANNRYINFIYPVGKGSTFSLYIKNEINVEQANFSCGFIYTKEI